MTGKSVEFVSTLRKHLHLEQIPRPFRSQVAFPKLKMTTHCLLLFLICFIFKHYHPSSSKGHIRLISPMLKQQTSLFMLLPLPALWQSIWVTGAMSLPFIDSTCVWYLLCPCISLVFVHFEQYTPIYIASLISLGIFFYFKMSRLHSIAPCVHFSLILFPYDKFSGVPGTKVWTCLWFLTHLILWFQKCCVSLQSHNESEIGLHSSALTKCMSKPLFPPASLE